jgi:decaprenylphospho-beta-D-ribofuranose 2-oxidase
MPEKKSGTDVTTLIPLREEKLTGWGLRDAAVCRVAAPERIEEIVPLLEEVSAAGGTIGLRGSGYSYGDASLNGGDIVLCLAHLNHIREWDAETGLVTVEPGVTITQLWRHMITTGWWPFVVPGASAVTVGGAASANVHGKNNWRAGCFGDHLQSFDLLLSSGQSLTCSRDQNSDLFYAAVGGLGLLGVFTSLTLQARRIYSGHLPEVQRAYPSLDAMLAALEEASYWATDTVGWVDTSASGKQLGRGLLKAGRDLLPGEDPSPEASLSVAGQYGRNLFQSLPRGLIPRLAKPMTTPPGAWAANRSQWLRGQGRHASTARYATYVGANFPLDFVPEWRETYRPGGLIQHQSMVPTEAAARAFRAFLERSQAAGMAPSLAVLKKHRASTFLMSCLVDGYSLALDFPVRRGHEAALLRLLRELNDVLADHGGRCYFVKDSTVTPDQVGRMFPADNLAQFHQLKKQYDPSSLFSTNLYRRALKEA